MSTYYGYLRKAWEIVGYVTESGNVFCAHCGDSGSASVEDSPIFVSDEYSDIFCDSCHEELR